MLYRKLNGDRFTDFIYYIQLTLGTCIILKNYKTPLTFKIKNFILPGKQVLCAPPAFDHPRAAYVD